MKGIILGAGIIGSAVAFELSRRGVTDLTVLDPDLGGELSSSERNAGGVRHLWQQEINYRLSQHSISLFETISEEIGFQQKGYLWLFSKAQAAAGEKIYSISKKREEPYELLEPTQIQKKFPFLDKLEDTAFALFGKKDGILNPGALKSYYRSEAIKKGVQFIDRKLAFSLEDRKGETRVGVCDLESDKAAKDYLKSPGSKKVDQELSADFVVVCTGAWSSYLLEQIKAPAPLQPIRRQICFFKAEDFEISDYGMIVDSSGVYFHSEGGNILAGKVLKEEPSGFNFDYDADFFETHIWPSLYERSTRLEKLKWITGWSGLYSYTPDTTGILGKIPGFQSTFEAHSFTGRGLMQSYGAACALSDLIIDRKFSCFDASALDRGRFKNNKGPLLSESLHI
jgi:sarcosine oxidase subunit beta